MVKTLRRVLVGFASAALLLLAASCQKPEDTFDVASVTFSPAGGNISVNEYVTLSCETEGAEIYWSKTQELTSSNFSEGTPGSSVQVTSDDGTAFVLYAIAVYTADSGSTYCSSSSSAAYTVNYLPTVTITPSQEADSNGDYASGTTFAITASNPQPVDGNVITIYYSTSTELTSENAETAGTVYVASGDNATVITLTDVLTISAIAKDNSGWSEVVTTTYKIPATYKKGAYEFDGNIAAALTAINSSTTSVTFDNTIDISGIVTKVANSVSSGKPYIYIQDKDSGIQIYGTGSSANYEVGDYVTVEGCAAGQVYAKSGVSEITSYSKISVDDSKSTRIIYFAEIPSYAVDFTQYLGHGTLLYAFRGTTSEHTTSPDYIYTYKNAVTDSEKINLGAVVSASSGTQFTLWDQLDADDTILAKAVSPVENVVFTPSADADADGYYAAGTTVELSCTTSDSTIYYSTSAFSYSDFNASSIDTNKFTKYESAITITDDTTIYAIAVATVDGDVCKSQVKFNEYLTPFTTSYAELSDTDNYELDGNLDDLVSTKPESADDVTYSGYIVAFNGTSKTDFLVQDKDAGAYFYGVSLPSNARVGSLIEFTLTSAKTYNGLYEVTGANVTVKEAKSQNTIYFRNITGENDWTDYQTGQLCGVRGNKSDYQSSTATIYMKNVSGTYAYFGFIYTYSTSSTVQMQALVNGDESLINWPEGYVEDPKFYIDNSVTTGASVAKDSTVEIKSSYPTENVSIYYQLVATADAETATVLTAENYSTAGTEYSSAVTLASGTLYAIAVYTSGETIYTSNVVSAEFEVINGTSVSISEFATQKQTTQSTTSGGVTTKITVVSGSNYSYYDGSALRWYAKNALSFTSEKNIEKIVITANGSSYAGITVNVGSVTETTADEKTTYTFTAVTDNGTIASDTSAYTYTYTPANAETKTVSLCPEAQIRVSSIVVYFAE